ncbi:uncharacterized protein DNG_01017 [Cephalotrichum gorgonifer]|uniref:Aminodeoxychorismate lyase n=1 Tax=Cephalotrichum gorgonifer TaxID=2041049 RepID=A0AAE8MQ37_9PEZI|nr:uncharacterized protein DNG_01017 [Cephalotrichum gorgonifer]
MDPFRLFTSLRYDPVLVAAHNDPAFKHAGWNFRRASPCYMLDLHRDRIVRAAGHWGWDKVVSVLSDDKGLEAIENLIENVLRGEGPARVRILVNDKGQLRCESIPEKERTLSELFPAGLSSPSELEPEGDGADVWDVLLDGAGTSKSEYTHYKTTRREMYNLARERAGIKLGEEREVLIVGGDGVVMEGSITTPYFWRGDRWVTPSVGAQFGDEGCGGQDGTTRRWALENGFAVEAVVEASSLVAGELIWLSNGAKGFIQGRLQV